MAFETIRYIRNEGAHIAYAVVEPDKPNGFSICLLASTGRGPEDFKELANALAQAGLHVLLPWPRGTQASAGPIDAIDFHDLAADVGAIIEAEPRAKGCLVAGHAYGCWIARTLANDQPDLISGLILIAAGGGKWPDALSQAINIAMSSDAPEEDRRRALQFAFFAPGNDPKPYLTGWDGNLVQIQRAARSRTDRDTWWPSGVAPILDLVGLQDPFRAANARDFYVKEFPGRVTLVTVDNASHALPEEHPARVADEIMLWFKTQF
jgi:pimeloyl-ACP methyl ester carboxylesterase